MKSYFHRSQHADAPRWRDHLRSVVGLAVIWFILGVLKMQPDIVANRRHAWPSPSCSAAIAQLRGYAPQLIQRVGLSVTLWLVVLRAPVHV